MESPQFTYTQGASKLITATISTSISPLSASEQNHSFVQAPPPPSQTCPWWDSGHCLAMAKRSEATPAALQHTVLPR